MNDPQTPSDAPNATPNATPNDEAAATDDRTSPASGQPRAEGAEVAPPDPLTEARAEASKLKDQLLRALADFDNYRKRARREVEDAQKKGGEELLRTLLPVFDNLERAVAHADGASDSKAIADGVRMVLKQFVDTLARAGIHRVAAVGSPFDPLVHEAIQQVETSEHAAGTVVAEVAPGYRLGDKLVRAAMVVVATPPSSQAPSA